MTKLVLIHGWALNSGVWRSFVERLTGLGLDVQCIDLPGYGHSLDVKGADDLRSMARYCLDKAVEPAIWVGWSLGGMVAMQAALLEPAQVKGMQLISTSPRFIESDDWPEGVDLKTFERFTEQLSSDYERTLTMFLLMQAGSNIGARALAKAAHRAVCELPNPSAVTLSAGIRCLASVDLRDQIASLSMPVQVISGLKDRVAKPESNVRLAALLGAELVSLDTGHAPFMTAPDDVVSALVRLIGQVAL